ARAVESGGQQAADLVVVAELVGPLPEHCDCDEREDGKDQGRLPDRSPLAGRARPRYRRANLEPHGPEPPFDLPATSCQAYAPGRDPTSRTLGEAAGLGFEPRGRFARPTVFKTAPFDRSGTPPEPIIVVRGRAELVAQSH